MNRKDLYQSMNQIDDEILERSEVWRKKKSSVWMKWGAMVACVCLIVGVGVPLLFDNNGNVTSGVLETEGTVSDVTQDIAGVGGDNLVTLTHMEEIKVKIDEMLPDGFIGTIEVGNDLFKVGKQISIIVQDNVTVVQKDGSIFDYDELEPNIPDSDLEIGSSVWVGFQKYDYVEGNGKYNQIFAYHIEEEGNKSGDEGFPNWGLTLSVKDVTESGLTLVCKQSGGEPTGELQIGSDYRLIVLKDGTWQDVPTIIEDYGWTSEAYLINKDDAREFEIKWEWLHGKLPAGTYRLVKGVMDFRESGNYDTFDYWVEFEIK